MATQWRVLVCIAPLLAVVAFGGPGYVPGFVPDWNQPYTYLVPNGPGPDPRPGLLDPWNAWCAPTSAANLVGHWEDQYALAVADGFVFPNTPNWKTPAWHDYQADGSAGRPAAGGGLPNAATDLGYYMDTNNLGMGLGSPRHAGTYLRDIHTGLAAHFSLVDPLTAWTTGTQGRGYAAGKQANGLPAQIVPNGAAAFAEIVGAIDAGRTMVVSWTSWNIQPLGAMIPGDPEFQDERQFDLEFYEFEGTGSDPWGNDEEWNYDDGGGGLGHAVTAVGYLGANDEQNPVPGVDWVIVHDNVAQTGRNIAVPLNFNVWVANTNAVPEPASVLLLVSGALLRRPRPR